MTKKGGFPQGTQPGPRSPEAHCNLLLCPGLWEGASLVAQMVKRLPALRETRVQSLGWEDTLEKEMASHSLQYS